MAKVTAGEAVVESLRSEGVRHVFGVVGHTFLPILDAFYGRSDIRFVGVRHEQCAAFMADGYAQVTGEPGLCLVVAGPGATNLLTGIAGAHVANSPVIVLVGGIPSSVRYKSVLQEMDLPSIFKPVTKRALLINKPERIPELLHEAFRTALSGRRGPVFVEMPQDVVVATQVEMHPATPESYRVIQRQPADSELIRKAARLLKKAQRPLLLAGGGVTTNDATAEVVRLAELLSIPVVTTYAHNDAMPNDHPLFVGPLGRAGALEATHLCRKADLLLVIGSRLGHLETYYDDRYIQPGTQIIQIDVDERYIGQIYPVAVGISGDAKAVVSALIQALKEEGMEPSATQWQQEAQELREQRLARLDGEGALDAVPIKPQRVYHELRRILPPNTIIALDAGACPAYGYDRLQFTHPHTFLAPLDLGCIGWAFPTALGAKLGRPEAPVMAIHGDGGYLMHARELATAVQERVPVITLVMNNNSWGSEKAYQREQYKRRYVGADITNPRFDQHAELFGARGFYVERPQDLGPALQEALTLDIPSVIEVPVDPEELPTPAHAPMQVPETRSDS